MIENIEKLYEWLHKTCPSKKSFEENLIEMKKKFVELEMPYVTTDNRPSAIWLLALTYLTHNRKEVKSMMCDGNGMLIIYK